ncbi:CWF19-like protein 1 isoform X2 [Haliotis rufescens]|uniref:CWF19-like protein 1 isoform X2 n=1 Tax=Haliotis rufescens TaxID=6454 RepID=UPI00201F9BF9|nr:CWF19-like protein 1 isoform X2 [Haliotis rufescens]
MSAPKRSDADLSSSDTVRCLVCGDVKGQFSVLFKRVNSLQKKGGKFEVLMCVGDFFGSNHAAWEDYTSGRLKVPISTLILGPNKKEHVQYYESKDGQEMCENVTYLGSRGRYAGSSGLQIAYLSGMEAQQQTQDAWQFTKDDILTLTGPVASDNNYRGIDVLLTSQWPQSVQKYATPSQMEATCTSLLVGEVARLLQPRYHFSGLNGIFYERQPYRNHQIFAESGIHVTRFIGLAAVGNLNKDKFLYAFSIKPLSHITTEEQSKQPLDATESPYKPLSTPGSNRDDLSQGTQFFYDMHGGDTVKAGKRHSESGGNVNKKRKQVQPPGPCWFCLGSPDVEKHLVVSVGMQTYLALAKGGLVEDHVLILPIEHVQSYVTSPSDVQREIISYKTCLKKYFKSRNKDVVFYERNYRTQHLQIQVVPVPQDVAMDLKECFLDMAQNISIELHEIPTHSDLSQIVPAGAPYFYAELPCGAKLLHRISSKFPLQFAREALAQPAVLDLPHRVDWRNCATTEAEATLMATTFKEAFQQYDFSL